MQYLFYILLVLPLVHRHFYELFYCFLEVISLVPISELIHVQDSKTHQMWHMHFLRCPVLTSTSWFKSNRFV